MQDFLHNRRNLDRRRLEQAFFQYFIAEAKQKHKLTINMYFEFDKMLEKVCEKLYSSFHQKWQGNFIMKLLTMRKKLYTTIQLWKQSNIIKY